MVEGNHRIIYALYSKKWRFSLKDTASLLEVSEDIIPSEFVLEMKGHIFCPKCFTPLSRSPSLTSVSSSGITAHFKHLSQEKYKNSKKCEWRTGAKPGLRYKNEEEVKQAIENEDLAIISGFSVTPPNDEDDYNESGEYAHSAIEDDDGEETAIPIGRHRGETVSVMGKFKTVMALCCDFPKNLKKGFFLPDSKRPMLLSDILYSTKKFRADSRNSPRLYFGKIVSFDTLNYRNAIRIETNEDYSLHLYTSFDFDRRKHISEKSVGRYLVFYVRLVGEGTLQAKNLDWGVYSLLPQKYDKFLPLGITEF